VPHRAESPELGTRADTTGGLRKTHTVERTAPLSVLDELYLHLDRRDDPFNVHLEIRVAGRIDAARLERAVRAAALLHPIARARLADARVTDVRHRWEIVEELTSIDLEEIECDSPAELARGRERVMSRMPDLDRPGPFALLLAHDRDGDTIVMNLHHAAGDGLSAVRLMSSIARAYGGEEDPVPDLDPLRARDLDAVSASGAGSLRQRIAHARAALEFVPRSVRTPTRIARQGGEERPGYAFELACFEPDQLERLLALRSDRATLNDVLLAGLAIAVGRWNERHGAANGPVYLTMPINLRPAEWRFEILGNFAAYLGVHLPSREQKGLAAAVRAAAASTRRIKDSGAGSFQIDFFALPSALPTGVKQHMPKLIGLTRNSLVDTAALSNLGRLPSLPQLGEAGAIRELWFSPPARMPLGAALGVATLEGRLFVTLRYRHALFDAGAASEFLATFTAALASPA